MMMITLARCLDVLKPLCDTESDWRTSRRYYERYCTHVLGSTQHRHIQAQRELTRSYLSIQKRELLRTNGDATRVADITMRLKALKSDNFGMMIDLVKNAGDLPASFDGTAQTK
jgi:hypothetical protein